MITWTYNKDGVIAVVTADNVDQAIWQLERNGIGNVNSTDLIPLPTHHRHTRVLSAGK